MLKYECVFKRRKLVLSLALVHSVYYIFRKTNKIWSKKRKPPDFHSKWKLYLVISFPCDEDLEEQYVNEPIHTEHPG